VQEGKKEKKVQEAERYNSMVGKMESRGLKVLRDRWENLGSQTGRLERLDFH